MNSLASYTHIIFSCMAMLSVHSHINCIVECWPDKPWISQSMCFYQVMMMLHFLDNVDNDTRSTQKSIF